MTSIEQLGGLTAQHNEIIKRVVNGSLNPVSAKIGLQGIIEGSNRMAESVAERVELQLDRWAQLGVVIDGKTREPILKQAEEFVPASLTDTPLVSGGFGYVLARCFHRLWEAYVPSVGYTKYCLVMHGTPLKYATTLMEPIGGLRLVHFDPNAYRTLSPLGALKQAKKDGVRLASIEVLEKLVLEPDWASSWDGRSSPYPNLSGLRTKWGPDWTRVPFFNRVGNRRVYLDYYEHDQANDEWSSPVVRER